MAPNTIVRTRRNAPGGRTAVGAILVFGLLGAGACSTPSNYDFPIMQARLEMEKAERSSTVVSETVKKLDTQQDELAQLIVDARRSVANAERDARFLEAGE